MKIYNLKYIKGFHILGDLVEYKKHWDAHNKKYIMCLQNTNKECLMCKSHDSRLSYMVPALIFPKKVVTIGIASSQLIYDLKILIQHETDIKYTYVQPITGKYMNITNYIYDNGMNVNLVKKSLHEITNIENKIYKQINTEPSKEEIRLWKCNIFR